VRIDPASRFLVYLSLSAICHLLFEGRLGTASRDGAHPPMFTDLGRRDA